MNIFRRKFLIGLLTAVSSLAIFSNYYKKRQLTFADSLSHLIDSIIPADEYPGALDLEIDLLVINQAKQDAQYLAKLIQLLSTIDDISHDKFTTSFMRSSLAQKSQVLNMVLSLNYKDVESRLLLLSLRNNIYTLYYTNPAAFSMLNYHPPSEGGYPDYDRVL